MTSIHKKSFAAEQLALRQKKKVSPVIWMFIGVIVVVLVVGGYVMYRRSVKVQVETEQIRSIAVLPFVDMSPEKDQEYFCDGLSEEIRNALSYVKSIYVPAYTSSVAFKGQQKTINEIGQALKVEAVLEGSVRKFENDLRIITRLTKVTDESLIWHNTYNPKMGDDLSVQEDIALAVVNALKIAVLDQERAVIEKRYTENSEAHDLYYQGRYHWNKRTDEGYDLSLKYYKMALDKDKNYALAYAGIADTYNMIAFENRDDYLLGKKAAKKSLEIDNDLPEAHTSLGWIHLYFEWDWSAAESEFKHAIEINPNYATAHHWFTDYYLVMGNYDEALESIKRAQNLDPLSPVINRVLMTVLITMRRYEDAQEQYSKAIKLFPDHGPLNYEKGRLEREQGNYQEAINVFEIIDRNDRWRLSALGYTYAISGQREKALRIIQELEKRVKESTIISIFIAQIYSGLGDNDKAFEWLDKAYEIRDPHLAQLKYQSAYDNIRSDPRFNELLRKMDLLSD